MSSVNSRERVRNFNDLALRLAFGMFLAAVAIIMVLFGWIVLAVGVSVVVFFMLKEFHQHSYMELSLFQLLAGTVLIVGAGVSAVWLRSIPEWGGLVLVWVALTVVATDIGAYFAGRRFGKTQLSEVSPNKTQEGAFGGVLAAAAVGVGFYLTVPEVSFVPVMVWSLVISIFSQFGDLLESAWKRQVGIKDSGRGMMGHGGFLDRFDGHTAAFVVIGLFQSAREVPIYV